jgi:Domain of unknown function (DUF4861)
MSRSWILRAAAALAALAVVLPALRAQDPKSLGFKGRFVIEIRNPGTVALENHPVVIKVNELRAFAPDFNSYNYAIFDETGGAYRLVPSQADDLDKDRNHEEIVILRDLPPASTVRLACYYSAKGSFRLMMSTPKAFARLGQGADRAGLFWESNLAAFGFRDGRVEAYGKLYPGLILQKLRTDDAKLQEWGMKILPAGETPGLGGLLVGDGSSRSALVSSPGAAGTEIRTAVLANGPLRALVKAEYVLPGPGPARDSLVVLFSAYADQPFSREDIVLSSASAPGIAKSLAVGLPKLAGGDVAYGHDQGILTAWGNAAGAVGEAGYAVLFAPADAAGVDRQGVPPALKINAKPGHAVTLWILGGWGRGIVTAAPPSAQNWARAAAELGTKLRVPVEVRFKAD